MIYEDPDLAYERELIDEYIQRQHNMAVDKEIDLRRQEEEDELNERTA